MAMDTSQEIKIRAVKQTIERRYRDLVENINLKTGNLGPMLVQEGYMTRHELKSCTQNQTNENEHFIDTCVAIKPHKWDVLIYCLNKTQHSIGNILQEEYERQKEDILKEILSKPMAQPAEANQQAKSADYQKETRRQGLEKDSDLQERMKFGGTAHMETMRQELEMGRLMRNSMEKNCVVS